MFYYGMQPGYLSKTGSASKIEMIVMILANDKIRGNLPYIKGSN